MELIEYNVMNCFTTVGILFWFVRLGLQLYWNFCRQGVLEVGTLVPARYDYATVAHCLCVICWILWATGEYTCLIHESHTQVVSDYIYLFPLPPTYLFITYFTPSLLK
ncbi:hypothetical protein F5B20DRAFT_300777 [Whalleya microplaca]|nr:hypothetical protein F5B20DRAFT_300777 [Whalleya microplaca]